MELFVALIVVGAGAYFVFKPRNSSKRGPAAEAEQPKRARDPQFDRLFNEPLSDNRVSAEGVAQSARPTATRKTAPKRPTPKTTAKPLPTMDNILDQTFRFVALDVETANADTSSICQLGLAMVTEERHVHTLSFLIDPEMPFADFNIDLHGISPKTVKGHPTFDQVFQALRAFLERHPMVQHSGFDKRAIEGACQRYSIPKPKLNWHDSVTVARKAWPELKGNGGHGLASLKTHLNLDFEHHDAAEDAKAAAQVVLLAEDKTGENFEELARGSTRGATRTQYAKNITLTGNQSGPLYGHVACFTGQLSMTRTDAATMAAGAGITVKANVSKKVTLLVVGDQDMTLLNGHDKSTKHRKADELIAEGHGIRIIGESEFVALINT